MEQPTAMELPTTLTQHINAARGKNCLGMPVLPKETGKAASL
ncbi:hypothetical protein [Paenarthrobacter nitroguajacolicus]|nr:hypothetical protein [Paenarthrobacter nitroguajacolicus]MDI2035692.1 hypothetical protein [Paenarthrobacter nitroguajacolicus]